MSEPAEQGTPCGGGPGFSPALRAGAVDMARHAGLARLARRADVVWPGLVARRVAGPGSVGPESPAGTLRTAVGWRAGRAVARFGPEGDALAGFDRFVRGCRFLAKPVRLAVQVAGDEIIENLLAHGGLAATGFTVMLRRRPAGVTALFCLRSHPNFASFAAGLAADLAAAPLFDSAGRRWHGLGLAMCQNLASVVRYRAGERVDRVVLEFGNRDWPCAAPARRRGCCPRSPSAFSDRPGP